MKRANQPGVGLRTSASLAPARSQHLVVGPIRQPLVRLQDDPADLLQAGRSRAAPVSGLKRAVSRLQRVRAPGEGGGVRAPVDGGGCRRGRRRHGAAIDCGVGGARGGITRAMDCGVAGTGAGVGLSAAAASERSAAGPLVSPRRATSRD